MKSMAFSAQGKNKISTNSDTINSFYTAHFQDFDVHVTKNKFLEHHWKLFLLQKLNTG